MSGPFVRFAAVAAFGLALGHLAWAVFGPPPEVKHYVAGRTAFAGPNDDDKHLYLRRRVFLTQRPRHAWLTIVSRDRVEVYVNGEHVASRSLDGFEVGLALDLTPHLKVGPNVVAVHAEQASFDRPPRVVVDGGYRLDDGDHPLGGDGWRCAATFERRAGYWFTPQFLDRHWPAPRSVSCPMKGEIGLPERAFSAPPTGKWITPPTLTDRKAAVKGSFRVDGRPRRAWLRVTATAAYRLAVNGLVIDVQDGPVATTEPVTPVERAYDVTSVARRGRNDVALLLTGTPGSLPHVKVDGEVEDTSGGRTVFGTDDRWVGLAGVPDDWLGDVPPSGDWVRQGIIVEAGDVPVPPWLPHRATEAISLPADEILRRVAQQALYILVAIVGTWLASAVVGAAVAGGVPRERRRSASGACYAVLVPVAAALGCGFLATYDPRVPTEWVYRPLWFWASLACVGLGWLAVGALANRAAGPAQPRVQWAGAWSAIGLVALVIVGAWLRVGLIRAEPLNPDEVTVYRGGEGVWERGLPSFVIHPDMPVFYLTTSELMFYPVALAERIFHDDCWAVRFPAVCWGVLTIPLVYLAGRKMFKSRAVGLIAATLYTFAPVVIQMTNFGRYFAQLQFFTLLTVYLFWETIRTPWALDRRALALTVLAFIATFLSWEAGALIALGMILAALLERRGRIRPMLGDWGVYAGMVLIVIVILAQFTHRNYRQVERLWYGTGASDITLTPMWRYPDFDLWYYVREASWNRDALLPVLGLVAALAVAARGPFRRPARFLLVIFFATAFFQALFLPVKAPRYAYHLTPIAMLLWAAALVAATRALARLAGRPWSYGPASRFAGAAIWGTAAVLVAAATGMTVQTADLAWAHSAGYRPSEYKFANLEGPVRFLQSRLRDGDVVMSTAPHVVDHLLKLWGTPRDGLDKDLWPQSRLHLQASLPDHRDVPLHRLYGVVMASDEAGLRRTFASHPRVWYVADPSFNHIINDPDVTSYLRQNMDVVYEDFSALVLLAGESHRPAFLRLEDEKSLPAGKADYLR